MIKKRLKIIFALALLPLVVNAQKTDSIKLPKIHVLARVSHNRIILRWAPDNANAWILGNRFGYTVERYTFLKNGKVTETRTKTVLTPSPLKPLPLEQWEKLADTSDYAAVAAQAIYGSDFEVNVTKPGDIYSLYNRSRELESRFTFALHAANQSLGVAGAAALSVTDHTVQSDESYLYRVYISLPEELTIKIDTGLIFIDAGKPVQLPKLRNIIADASGNAVMLSWSTERYERDYVSYTVERSDDSGKNFHAVTDKPYVSLGTENAAIPGRAVFMDSVPLYDFPYFYRIRGRSPFAETGPPSDTVKIIATQGLYNPPALKSSEIINGVVILKWEMPNEVKGATKGFYVERASSVQGTYSRLNKNMLPPEARLFADSVPLASNYYHILAIDKKGYAHSSLPYFVQPEDSMPPALPLGLTGTIDTAGIVHLNWKKNKEADLLGYRVYRSYFTSAEFVQVTIDPIKQNSYMEKVNLKNLNKFFYYKITANDTHHNQSGFSITLQIRQPDIMPPSPPAVSSVTATENGIRITMIPGSSDDVEKYVVYRKEESDTIWTLQSVIAHDANAIDFTDSSTLFGQIYVYNVLAVDTSGNESVPARTIKCKALNNNNKSIPKIWLNKNVEKKAVEIKWLIKGKDIQSVIIYKATGSEPLVQYTTINAKTGAFMDTNIKISSTYRYMIKGIYTDGTESGFSKIETIDY